MKRLLCVAVLISSCLVVVGCDARGGEPGRHYEKDGGFSYVPPSGWKIIDFGGLKYKAVVGPAKDGFAVNLNCVEEAFTGTVEAYTEGSLATLPKVFPTFRLLRREKFKTDKGLEGMKLIFETDQQGRRLRQCGYFLPMNNKMLVITGSALAQGGEGFDAVFDGAVKTFRLGK
ncbi:MAG TPA: hypothetical protein VEL76_35625 [Gemmataceae bacterium]|nr:hypothetical protein [Gemmataceae bacterium]